MAIFKRGGFRPWGLIDERAHVGGKCRPDVLHRPLPNSVHLCLPSSTPYHFLPFQPQTTSISLTPLPVFLVHPVVDDSGSGSVDFQEFVGGLSAFSSKGGRDEKLKCKLGPILSLQSGPASIISDMKGEEQS